MDLESKSSTVMSLSAVMGDINLVGEQIFDHTALIEKQVNKFLVNFERNERYKEFDGIIRASHSLVEATDAHFEPILAQDDLEKLSKQIQKAITTLSSFVFPLHQKEHESYLEAIRKNQQEQKGVVQLAVERQRQELKQDCFINFGDGLTFPDFSSSTEIILN